VCFISSFRKYFLATYGDTYLQSCTREAEARGPRVGGHLGLHIKILSQKMEMKTKTKITPL
jgi:hypothetical protein